jgi:hypothetical protein
MADAMAMNAVRLARFMKAQISDRNFTPIYGGVSGSCAAQFACVIQ